MIEIILVNYIASVAAGITLGLIGLTGISIYKKNLSKQKNKNGDNIINNIGTQNIINNATNVDSPAIINNTIK